MAEAGPHKVGRGIGDGDGRQHEEQLDGRQVGGGQQEQRHVGEPGHEDAAGGKGVFLDDVPAEEEAHGGQHEARPQTDQRVLRPVHPAQDEHAPAQGYGAEATGDAAARPPEQGEELPEAQGAHDEDDEQQGPAANGQHRNDERTQNDAGQGAANVGGMVNRHRSAPAFCRNGGTVR